MHSIWIIKLLINKYSADCAIFVFVFDHMASGLSRRKCLKNVNIKQTLQKVSLFVD